MSLAELLEQRAHLERQIEAVQSQKRAQAIEQIRALMAAHGLTAADLAAGLQKRAAKVRGTGKPVAAKYKDSYGNSWSGRGLRPKWLTAAIANGATLEEFAI